MATQELDARGASQRGMRRDHSDGVRVPDVTWIYKARRDRFGKTIVLPIAPEICIEILSPFNHREEMLGKMILYYAKGAKEVWLCDENGQMEFFAAESAPKPIPASRLCPNFPKQIELASIHALTRPPQWCVVMVCQS